MSELGATESIAIFSFHKQIEWVRYRPGIWVFQMGLNLTKNWAEADQL
jgi:hypothetical protein